MGFDLEIFNNPDEESDVPWPKQKLGISCIGLWPDDQEECRLFWNQENPTGAMTPPQILEAINAMWSYRALGYEIATWNGLAFDFQVLAVESGEWFSCRELAVEHVDMMFHFYCTYGHLLGINAAAEGAGVGGKLEGMSGALAPDLWKEGKTQKVLDYLAQDCKMTNEVAAYGDRTKTVKWTSKSGKQLTRQIGEKGWLPVHRAACMPIPNTSWMKRDASYPTRRTMMRWVFEGKK